MDLFLPVMDCVFGTGGWVRYLHRLRATSEARSEYDEAKPRSHPATGMVEMVEMVGMVEIVVDLG